MVMRSNMDTNSQAWDILNSDEKTSLSLSLGFGKSTWESGEIMKKAHFKYLEIQKRARRFLEMFTNHFEKYGGLFPADVLISFAFKEYLILTILERKSISKAVRVMEDQSYSVASRRNKLIMVEIDKLRRNPIESYQDLNGLIMDFDRWNNFRILPLEVQEPSAFKRRNKVRNVKHLKNITTLPKFSVLRLIEKYSYSGKYSKIYLPIISQYVKGGYKVVTMKDTLTFRNEITSIGLFLFDDRAKAVDFSILVYEYFVGSVRNCKTGQQFWPRFRVMMAEAINYKELENIYKSRTYLDKAIFDHDRKLTKLKPDAEARGEQRVDNEKLFYGKVK